jgi:integrase/recombinase XerD
MSTARAAETREYLEPQDVDSLVQAAVVWDRHSREMVPCLRDQILVRLLFRLGCRISEALGIEVTQVDLERGTVRIEHLKARIKLSCPNCGARLGKSHAFCPGCGENVDEALSKELEHRRMRTLPLDTETLDMLRGYIERGGPVSRKGKQLLFGINRHRAWQIVRDCARRAGLPRLINPETGRVHGVSPHRLRDAFAVNAVKHDDSGDGLRLLQEHLGHTSFNTTARYRKVAGEEHREWYQKLWKGKTD